MELSIDSCMCELIQAITEKVYEGTADKYVQDMR